MTENEAINKIQYRINTASEIAGRGEDGKAFEDLEIAIQSLEKQIPKKPILNNRRTQCTNGHNLPIQRYKYCPFCGQKIDWQ